MPSKSKKQHDFMSVVAHNPDFAAKVDVPQSVGQEFVKADKSAGKFKHPGDKRGKEESRIGRHAKNKGHKVRGC